MLSVSSGERPVRLTSVPVRDSERRSYVKMPRRAGTACEVASLLRGGLGNERGNVKCEGRPGGRGILRYRAVIAS